MPQYVEFSFPMMGQATQNRSSRERELTSNCVITNKQNNLKAPGSMRILLVLALPWRSSLVVGLQTCGRAQAISGFHAVTTLPGIRGHPSDQKIQASTILHITFITGGRFSQMTSQPTLAPRRSRPRR